MTTYPYARTVAYRQRGSTEHVYAPASALSRVLHRFRFVVEDFARMFQLMGLEQADIRRLAF